MVNIMKSNGQKSDPEGRRQLFTENLKNAWDGKSPDAIELVEAYRLSSDEKKEINKTKEKQNKMSGMDKGTANPSFSSIRT